MRQYYDIVRGKNIEVKYETSGSEKEMFINKLVIFVLYTESLAALPVCSVY